MSSFTPQEIEQFLQEFFDVVGARQYTGARYVPIFGRAGSDTVEWDDLAPYEPLTVVMHEGVSYVSRRYVPRGIQITDTAYWVETYRFNAQVEQYRQEVLSFDSRIRETAEAIQLEAEAREQGDNDTLETVHDEYVPFPDPDTYPKYGTEGQVLSTLADGTTKWDDPVTVDADVAGPLIEAWLDEHPEATTTVEDGSITYAKLNQTLIDGLTRIARPSTVTTLNQDSTNNTVTTTLVENAYVILDATVANPGRYTATGLFLGSAKDFKNKNVTVVVEVAQQTNMAGSSVIAYVTKANSWGPADKIEVWNKANWQQSETVMKRSLTPSDLLAFADSDQFWVMVNVQDQPAACSYKLRAYVVVNDAASVEKPQEAYAADTAAVAELANAVGSGGVHWSSLDQQLNDGLTRIARPSTVTTLNQDSTNNTVTTTLVENAYVILDATVANPGRYTATGLFLGSAKDFKNKNVTVVVEVAQQTGMDGSTVVAYMTKQNGWGPADKIELWKITPWRQGDSVMKRSVTPSDLLAFADSDDFWVMVNVEGQRAACSYKLRAYVVVNDAAYLGPDTYDTDLLFWGDSLTAGAGGGGTTYPGVCASVLGLDYVNGGVGGETANTIAARQGGNSLIIPPGTVNGTYSLAQFVDVYGARIAPLRQGSGSGTGSRIYVNGDKANLAINQTSATDPDATYTISGYYGGNINREMPAYFEGAKIRGRIVVIWVGQNGSYIGDTDSVNARISIIDSMISHIGHDRYVVLGLSTGTDASRADDDAAMLAHYGNKFLPTRHMLVGYGLTIEGITPTSQDQTDIAAGTVPTSLRSDGTHLNSSGYDALGKIVADKVRSLGYV